ncbi:MAG: TIGR04283 family arsenosugar biosynthesis glycosyltransferase [Desulfomonilaceae bacterium]
MSTKKASGEKIIIFTRYPEPGKTKTRLIPVLGAEGAADLQRRMAEHVLAQAQDLAASREIALEVCYEGGDEALLSGWLGSGFSYCKQHTGNLGTRMHEAFKEAFLKGSERVLIVGTDCPGLTDNLLETAFEDLREHDVVLGPARDGGYYLIGLKRLSPSLFHDIQWGAHEVLGRTLDIARRNGLSWKLVELMDDIDRPEDLEEWDRNQKVSLHGLRRLSHSFESERHDATPAIISVIIPTLNEAHILAATLETVRETENVEIIVADGGSSDETIEVAGACNVRSLQVSACRAAQMNTGAKAACGGILLFLHADTRLPGNWASQVRSELEKPRVAGGAFSLKLDEDACWSEIIERLANIRSRRLHMPYGDQAIFIRAHLFHEMGGFAQLPIMEDFEFMRRLRKRGRISIVPEPVVTSARRWRESGVWWTTAVNQAVIIGYFLGVSPHLLARLYHFKSRSADHREVSRRKSFI